LINNPITELKPHTYFIIAGEQSADNHGALLMQEMLAQNPEIDFKGIGGKKMTNAGLNSIEEIDKMAVMGFIEVIRHLAFFRKLTNRVLAKIEIYKPKQIILID
jgi:lipid-A-disaccharide synthase